MKLIMSTVAAKLRPLSWITRDSIYRMQASAANMGKAIARGDRGLVAAELDIDVGAMVSIYGAAGSPGGQYQLMHQVVIFQEADRTLKA